MRRLRIELEFAKFVIWLGIRFKIAKLKQGRSEGRPHPEPCKSHST